MNSITVQITRHPAGGQPVGTELSLHPSYGNWSTTLASRPEHNQAVLGTGSVGISGTRLLAIGDSITVLEADACCVPLEGFSLESTPAGSTGSGSIMRLTPGSWVSLVGSLLEVAVKSFREALGMDPITRSLHLSESERDRLEFALNYAAGQSAEYGDGVVKTIFAELMEKRQYSRDYVRYAPVSLGAMLARHLRNDAIQAISWTRL